MKRVHQVFYSIVKYFNSFILFSMFTIILLQVIFRKLLGNPLPWPEEISLLTMIWVTFIGAYQCTVEDSHLKMTFLENKLSKRKKSLLQIFSRIIVIFFLGLTNYYALPFIRTAGDTQLPITNIPMTVPYGIIWIALTLMLIEVVIQIITEIKNIANLNKNKISEEGK